jgi:hypothetical protein
MASPCLALHMSQLNVSRNFEGSQFYLEHECSFLVHHTEKFPIIGSSQVLSQKLCHPEVLNVGRTVRVLLNQCSKERWPLDEICRPVKLLC